MSLCRQLRPFLDGETGPLLQWRMRRHLLQCPACSEQKAAEEELGSLLALEFGTDTPEEAAAVQRVARAWQASVPQHAAPRIEQALSAPRFRLPARRWMTASAALAVAVGAFAVGAVTGPRRALAAVAGAMAKVQRFHVRMEVPGYLHTYEAWGERGLGTRVVERVGDTETVVVLDDGRRLLRYYPKERVVRESGTRLKRVFQHAAGFNASRMLRLAARGKLFDGQDWIGEATAREVARVMRNGKPQRRIQVDLEGGFFERMIVYGDIVSDRLTQVNLYTDSRSPDDEPFARVFFDYPEELDAKLFRLEAPPGTEVRHEESDLEIP